ncbi:MAG TPA: hypothetical protein VK308_14090 [Pyrinomonadaceae bacterium]|nr:hypothetical protein [Pyrinomonadaceae bacterium]
MKKIKCLSIIFACLCFLLLPVINVNAATRYTVGPLRGYEKRGLPADRFFPDYVVEFNIPANASQIVAYSASTGIESRVFAYSITDTGIPPQNGRKTVLVVTGYRARHCSHSILPSTWQCNYTGSIVHWTNTVRLRYYL